VHHRVLVGIGHADAQVLLLERHLEPRREVTADELDAFDPTKLLECVASTHFDGIDAAFIH
ncbi:MAG: hypothetical protein EBX02_09785, partial [Betaproteobacteria bacterium]|nr:hypothetical protein [Betaproteobacteria bacterium]